MRVRLAMAYAPKDAGQSLLGLFALDARLAAIVRRVQEPLLAQVRLAWWRERLAEAPETWPEGEPVLAALRDWPGERTALSGLVDGWEAMLEEAPAPPHVFIRLAEARAGALAVLGGEGLAARRMGRNWALADVAGRVSHAEERTTTGDLVRAQDWRPQPLPRGLRPLAILHALAARDLRAGTIQDRISPLGLLTAMRVGLIGR